MRIITGTPRWSVGLKTKKLKWAADNIGQYNHDHILNVSMSIFDKLELMKNDTARNSKGISPVLWMSLLAPG